jgi:hypothetical protein
LMRRSVQSQAKSGFSLSKEYLSPSDLNLTFLYLSPRDR